MVFTPEREAAYLEQMFEWQRLRLRWLVLLAPVLLVLFVALQSLLMRVPIVIWLREPALYVYLAALLGLALWMRTLRDAITFAWAGVALQTAFCLASALMTRPGHGALALVLPLFVATPLVTAPFWARRSTVIVAIVLGYLAGSVALWHSNAGSTIWLAFGIQAAVGSVVALVMHATVDQARRGYFVAEEELAQRARLDFLTSVLNRRHFIEAGEALVESARPGRNLSACFIDLDHFKRVNDEGSHRIGDQLLVAIAQRLLAAGGGRRLIGRLGGEEFALLLPGVPIDQAQALAQQLCAEIAAIDIEGFSVTASVGVAAWRPGESLSDLLHRADLALLAAKRNGRNRIVRWSPELEAVT